jgi:hypothetical protein
MTFEHGTGSPLGMFAPLPPGEEITARAGEPLPDGTVIADREAVIAALRTVHDPEIPVNIYDLGLIYDFGIHTDGSVRVDMSPVKFLTGSPTPLPTSKALARPW